MQNEWIVIEINGLISISSVLEATLDLTVRLSLSDGIPLIVELFTAAKADLDLKARVFEVDLKRHQRIPLLGYKTL